MRKLFGTNTFLRAKTSVAFATCILVALSTLNVAADDKDKQENPAKQAPAKGGAAELQPSPSTPSVNSELDADKSQGGAGKSTGAQTGGSSQLSRADEKFVRDAAKSGMMEVHMGKMAVEKAQNAQVKQFGQRLIDDHTKANTELKQFAAKKGVTLPDAKIAGASDDADRTQVRESTASGTGGKEKAHMQRLHGLSGTEFDREFVRMAVTEHEKDVKEFERAAQKCDDAELKAWAQKTAPILREHLQQAKSLQAQVGGTTGGSQ